MKLAAPAAAMLLTAVIGGTAGGIAIMGSGQPAPVPAPPVSVQHVADTPTPDADPTAPTRKETPVPAAESPAPVKADSSIVVKPRTPEAAPSTPDPAPAQPEATPTPTQTPTPPVLVPSPDPGDGCTLDGVIYRDGTVGPNGRVCRVTGPGQDNEWQEPPRRTKPETRDVSRFPEGENQ